MNNIGFPIFIGWVLKAGIVKLGGVKGFRDARPFFIGLILGHFFGIGISFIVDMIFFPGNGHPVLHG